MLPSELLTVILKFLDKRTLALISPRVCKQFYNHCGLHSNGPLHSNGYMGHIYESITFPRSIISKQTSDDSWQERYFRSNVTFLLEELAQPSELQISVFMRSKSGEICLSEVASIAIEVSISNEISTDDRKKVHVRALEFLEKLVNQPKVHLENLKLSKFLKTKQLMILLSKVELDLLLLKDSFLE